VTGYMLVFPFFFTDIAGMQLSHIIHSIVSVLMIAVMLAHIYIGTLGMDGASAAMTTGQVDLNWARQHHNLWVEQELAKGRAADAPPGAKAAGAD
jgi:formate dehydrogenase subunit gamma